MEQLIRRYGRRLIAFAVCLLLIGTESLTADGAETAADQTVKAGIFYFDGYHMKDEAGDLTGYGIEVLDLISRYSHLDFDYVGYDEPWDAMLTMLEEGQIDVVTSARKTPEREEKFAFSLPIGKADTVLSVRAGNTERRAGDHKTYEGMIVGILIGRSQDQKLARFAAEKGFSYKIREFRDMDELAAALQDGRIDAILSSNFRKTQNEKVLDVITTDDLYAVVRKEDTALLDEINYGIEQMDINEGDWSNDLFYRYYGPVYASARTFTQREAAYIQAVVSGEKKVTVTALGDRKPYSYVEDGQLKGILPDYFAKVMELAGLPYETVVPEDRAAYYALAKTDGVDVVIDERETKEAVRADPRRGFDTVSYMTTGVAKVTRKGRDDEIKVVATALDQGKGPIEQGLGDGVTMLAFPTRQEALEAVLDGRADAAFAHTYMAQLFVRNDVTDSLQYSMANNVRFDFMMHVSSTCDHELVTILDKCIRQMPGDTLDQLIAQYTAYKPEKLTFLRYVQGDPQILAILVLVLALGMGMILALILRNRWNQKVIDATERSKRELEEQLAIVAALSRDYLNVFAVDKETGDAWIIKLAGYVTTGLDREQKESFLYETALHQYIQERVYSEDQPYLKEVLALDRVKEKLETDMEYTGSYRVPIDGEMHDFQFTYVKVEGGGHGKDSVILAGFRNIDEMVRKEQEQKKILAEALAEAQKANIAKTTFLNNMSHDIRTPMNAIIGFTSLAISHIEDKELVLDYLGKIKTSSDHLLNLINDVLDMSRIESGKVELEAKVTSLSQILDDLQTIVQSDIKAKQLTFSMERIDLTDVWVLCDKLRLQQVLLNILSNAVKYTRPGGEVRFLAVQTERAEEGAGGCVSYQFRIQDTGIGMSQTFLKHLFEPFEREETATVSGIQGTGLGLSITKSIVDMMDGTIEVTSQVGKGTEFTVSFCFPTAAPVEALSVESKRLEQTASISRRGADIAGPDGRKLLLVEDNELNQEIARTILEEAGFCIDTADDGTVAVEKIGTAPAGTYDLILMDVQMPVMDGYQATRMIRAMEDLAKATIPIVAMTANAFEEDRQKAAQAGMDGYVAKPIDVERLMVVLEEILR